MTLTMDAKTVGTKLNCFFLPSFLARNVSFFVPLVTDEVSLDLEKKIDL